MALLDPQSIGLHKDLGLTTPCHTIEYVDVQLTQQAIMPGVTNLGGCSSEPHSTVKNKRKAAGKRPELAAPNGIVGSAKHKAP